MTLTEKMNYYENELALLSSSPTRHYAFTINEDTLRVELRWEWHGLDSYRFIFSDNRVIDVLATPFWDGEIDGLPITVVADDGDSEFDTMVPLPEFSGDVDTDRRRLVETVTAVIVAYVAARV